MKSTLPVIAITIGDPNGIGPEVTLKALSKRPLRELFTAVLIGPLSVFEKQNDLLGLNLHFCPAAKASANHNTDEIQIINVERENQAGLKSGEISREGGRVAGMALDKVLALTGTGEIDALVTAPISKEALNLAGYRYPGHTEMLAARCQTEDVVMVLLSGSFRVALVTTHCALSDVSPNLTTEKIFRKLDVLDRDLKSRFNIAKPCIAVTALNPHAGEGGMFGSEENEVILPSILAAKKNGIDVRGPFPADTLFARIEKQRFDVYLAMYHDQGLIPFKMKTFGKGVNYTAGLPFIRTSPDHGTAFDIAGKGVADSSSMEEAIKVAIGLAKNHSNS